MSLSIPNPTGCKRFRAIIIDKGERIVNVTDNSLEMFHCNISPVKVQVNFNRQMGTYKSVLVGRGDRRTPTPPSDIPKRWDS